MSSYNSQAGNSKKCMFLKKRIDYDIPQNIMTMVSIWIDCYNSSISEKTKIKMHYDFEHKINDTSTMTSSKKMSNSCKRSENDKIKIQNDIFKWLASMDDKNVDFYSEKLGSLMGMDKTYIIKTYVNNFRIMNKMKEFNPNFSSIKKISNPIPTPIPAPIKKEEKEEKKEEEKKTEYPLDKSGRVIYGDAWDM